MWTMRRKVWWPGCAVEASGVSPGKEGALEGAELKIGAGTESDGYIVVTAPANPNEDDVLLEYRSQLLLLSCSLQALASKLAIHGQAPSGTLLVPPLGTHKLKTSPDLPSPSTISH